MTEPRARIPAVALCFTIAALAIAGCNNEKSTTVAPTAEALTASMPAAAGAQKFTIDKDSSDVQFLMDAPKEKIHGKADKSTTGELDIDLADVTKTVGVIHVDISGLEIFQAVVDEKTGKIGEEKKNDQQNEHVRNWLEIAKDVPDAERAKNGNVEFSVKKIEPMGDANVMKMSGAERKVMLKVTGDFLLHGHKADKTAELEATFHFDGDKPTSVHVKTTKPFSVGLAEYDVKPREAFGKLAAKTLDILAPKVAKEAEVTVEFTAKVAGGATPAKAP